MEPPRPLLHQLPRPHIAPLLNLYPIRGAWPGTPAGVFPPSFRRPGPPAPFPPPGSTGRIPPVPDENFPDPFDTFPSDAEAASSPLPRPTPFEPPPIRLVAIDLDGTLLND